MSDNFTKLQFYIEQLTSLGISEEHVRALSYDYALMLYRVQEDENLYRGLTISPLRMLKIMDRAADLLKSVLDGTREKISEEEAQP